jgi:tetratricopeptide (TPR) repeat protein
VLQQNPDDSLTLQHYSQLLVSLGRGAEAEKLLREAAGRLPNAAWPRFQLGVVLSAMDKDDAARQQFEAGLKISPDDAQAQYYLGVLAQRGGDVAGAKKQWEQVIASNPDYVDAYVALAGAALAEHDLTSAERYLRDGLKHAPNHPGLANTLAWILATSPNDAQRNGSEAVALAERACALTQRQQHQYLDTLAAAYAEVGRFDDAVKTIKEALDRLKEGGGDEATTAAYQARLALYERKQPYRDVK